MDLQEARSLLGAELGMDPAAVRRAYLRTLKKHPPERDPEGFARVRQAYELLQRAPMARTVDTSEPVEVPLAPLVASPLAPYQVQVEAAAEPDERRRIARGAAETLGTREAYELWADTVDDGGQDDELERALRSAVAAGHGEFSERLRERLPARLSDDELRQFQAQPAALQRAHEFAEIWLERKRPAEAARVLLDAYAASARDPFALRPHAWAFPGLVLELLLQHHTAYARRVLAAFEAAYPADARGNAVQYGLVRELVQVYDELDGRVADYIAEALRDHRPESAEELLKLRAQADRKSAKKQAALLEARAPLLAQLYARALRDRPAISFAFPEFQWWWCWLAISMLRLCGRRCDDDADAWREPAPQVQHEHQEAPS